MSVRFGAMRDVSSAEGLSATERKQVAAAGKQYDGEDVPADVRLAADGDEELVFAACRYGKCVDGETHVFDAWLYNGDSGTIFRAGTTRVVAKIIQCGLECGDAAIRAQLGAAMVEARLLPRSDMSYAEFSEALAKQGA